MFFKITEKNKVERYNYQHMFKGESFFILWVNKLNKLLSDGKIIACPYTVQS